MKVVLQAKDLGVADVGSEKGSALSPGDDNQVI